MYTATATAINPDDRTVFGVYKPRNPAASHYFQCVSAHWEELEPVWDDLYQRKKADQDDDIAHIIGTGLSDKAFRKSWARLIQKIYEVDPLP